MPRILANIDDDRPRGLVRASTAARLLGVVCLPLALSGCYLLQAASGQLDVARRSRPIETVLAEQGLAPEIRPQLELVPAAREFAVRELGLPDGRSYREYADLGRAHPLWNLVATPEFSVEPERWCFPIAGCVAYRGYFRERDALSAARRYARSGRDVSVGGVATYSTLGHLRDPVFRSMLDWRPSRLVATIFHEMAHEQLYVAGDTAFNEAYATVVADAGLELWLTQRGQHDELVRVDAARSRERQFTALLRDARDRLSTLYASGIAAPTLRVQKQREFGRLKFEYASLRARWGGYEGYDAWFARTLNNAHLAAVATYDDCVPGLERELVAAGSMRAFHARAAEIGRWPPEQRRSTLCAPASGSGSRASPSPGGSAARTRSRLRSPS